MSTLISQKRRQIGLLAVVLVLVAGAAGTGWAIWWFNDNLDGPGPGPTGSGPCSSADSVNIQIAFADGHTVDACTHDRPACPNQIITGSENGQTSSAPQFGFSNQLRSSTSRYIFTLSFNGALSAEAADQTLQIYPGAFLPGPGGPGRSSNGMPTEAVVQVTPRDPSEDGYTPQSGSVTVSSSHGMAQGRIDASFVAGGAPRPDRPAPTSTTASPVRITGTFACNHL
ncbi:MAG TPA: hypothetical protein VNU19_08200 [Candidatus Acidoferrum sp.]|nr:hypothetical protein [Candidatus Acidoferrum sp.]